MVPFEIWQTWRERGTIEADQDLLAMLKELVNTIQSLERMYGGRGASLVVRSLLMDWQSLMYCAEARNLKDYARP